MKKGLPWLVGTISGLGRSKKILRFYKIGKQLRGLNILEYYTQTKGIKIQSISIVVPQRDFGKMLGKELEMRKGMENYSRRIRWNHGKLLQVTIYFN